MMTKRTLRALNLRRRGDLCRSVEIYDVETESSARSEYLVLTDQQLDELVEWLQTLQRERDEEGGGK